MGRIILQVIDLISSDDTEKNNITMFWVSVIYIQEFPGPEPGYVTHKQQPSWAQEPWI